MNIASPLVAENTATNLATSLIKSGMQVTARGPLNQTMKDLNVADPNMIDAQKATNIGMLVTADRVDGIKKILLTP
ncbi:MAG TPA: hypothetical protein VGL77_06085 [Armatimonadota bacterium]|jgi:hypothetical protein